MAPPTTMRALKVKSAGTAQVVDNVPLPALRPGYVLVKVTCAALNPADIAKTDWPALATPGATLGCDCSGVVVQIGPDVTKDVKVGDRVGALTHGGNSVQVEDGCFAEYAVVKQHVLVRFPEDVSDEMGATVGVAFTTIGLALYRNFGLPLPGPASPKQAGEGEADLLVYGGGSQMGMFGIQFAKISGLRVIATSSPRNFELLKSYGADAVFDYQDPDCSKKINEYTGDSLKYCLDCIGKEETAQICATSLSSKGGDYASLYPLGSSPRADVTNYPTFGYTTFGEYHKLMHMEFPAMPEVEKSTREFFELAEKLLGQGKIKNQWTVMDGGLDNMKEGFDLLREGKVHATKLVYRIS